MDVMGVVITNKGRCLVGSISGLRSLRASGLCANDVNKYRKRVSVRITPQDKTGWSVNQKQGVLLFQQT